MFRIRQSIRLWILVLLHKMDPDPHRIRFNKSLDPCSDKSRFSRNLGLEGRVLFAPVDIIFLHNFFDSSKKCHDENMSFLLTSR
jgi:hypothetical protein